MKSNPINPLTIAVLGLLALMPPCLTATGADSVPAEIQFAQALSSEGNHPAAAIEFRRLATTSTNPCDRASFYWAAAYEYGLAGNTALSDKMLDQAENLNPDLATEAILLRGNNALSTKRWKEAEFYFQGLTQGTTQPVTCLASRSLAVTRLHQRNIEGARESLTHSTADEQSSLAAIDQYARRSDKSPRIGGLLGLVPGLGYAYSGEYQNALRSLILNSIFIFGMVSTAADDQWGSFAVISFFEVTWYSGSIYGGIDAAHRYNQERLNQCTSEITRDKRATPDYSKLPLLRLQF
jgi:hypothetical protein